MELQQVPRMEKPMVLKIKNVVVFLFYGFLWILTCISITAQVIDMGWTSVSLSVCLSVTRWCCVETAQPIVKLSLLPDSPMILVF